MNTSLPAKSRSSTSARNKFPALVVGTLALLFGVMPITRAAEHVVTIYFGGTGLTENGYTQGDSRTGYGNTRWDTPSLLAALHHNQKTPANHHKIFIPGVGAKETSPGSPANHCDGNPKLFPLPPLHAFLQQALANVNLCRNWKQTVSEAWTRLDEDVLGDLPAGDTVILNVVGHSRGAIAAMWFLARGFRPLGPLDTGMSSGLFTKVNLIALEPVPGVNLLKGTYKDIEEYPHFPPTWLDEDLEESVPGFDLVRATVLSVLNTYVTEDPYGEEPMGWGVFRLDGRVNKFVAIYAADERANKFGALVPYIGNIPHTATNTLMFRVRGSHQTMVGNRWKGGHSPQSFPVLCPWPYTDTLPTIPPAFNHRLCAGAVHDPLLTNVHNVVAIAVMELLSGPEWGGVDFGNDNDFLKDVYDPDDVYAAGAWDHDRSVRGASFGAQIDEMNTSSVLNKHYGLMRISSFLPGPLWPVSVLIIPEVGDIPPWIELPAPPPYVILPAPLEEFVGSGCERPRFQYPGDPGPFEARAWTLHSFDPRCMVRVLADGKQRESLESMSDVRQLGGSGLSGAQAWERIRVLAYGDDDVDGVTNDMDYCPGTGFAAAVDSSGCSDAQVDGDGDGVCSPGAPSAGPSACVGIDNCPVSFNPGQRDIDGDDLGDVCDARTNARGALELIRDDVQALLDGGTCGAEDDKRLAKAVDKLDKAIAMKNLTVAGDLDPRRGKTVYSESKKDAKELYKILNGGEVCAASAGTVLDTLTEVMLLLARMAIDDAQIICDAEPDPARRAKCQNEVDEANDEMAKAVTELAEGKRDKAIDKYKKAWEKAQKVL